MGVLRAPKAGYDNSLGLIAKRLREAGESITQEPMPARFRDLVRELDRRAEKETASLKMEVLEELLSTSEPTAKTRTLLKCSGAQRSARLAIDYCSHEAAKLRCPVHGLSRGSYFVDARET